MRTTSLSLAVALCALAFAAPLTAQYDDGGAQLAEPRRAATDDLADLVAAHLGFLASDAMGGRETGTLEGDITARYVEAQFRRLGLEPAGDDGGYLQAYPLTRTRLLADSCHLALTGTGNAEFTLREDYGVSGASEDGVDEEFDLAWAGWGLADQELGLDDYADLDVSGRLVLMYNGAPRERTDLLALSRSTSKQDAAMARGARGVVFVLPDDDPYSGRLMGFLSRRMGRASIGLAPDTEQAGGAPRLYVTESVARAIFEAAELDWSEVHAASVDEPGVGGGMLLDGPRLRVRAAEEVERFEAANVAGLLRGSDPELSDEVLVLSAHMDHEGRRDDGEVYNGADDNASGTTAVLVAAERLARDPAGLARSVLFLAVSGEEKGLLGSEYFVKHPPIALENIVGNINIDMVGRNDAGAVGATPSPDHPRHNTLAARSVAVGERVGLTVEWEAGREKYRRPVDTYYARSDHMHFSNAGIPVVFFFSGEHDDYHKVTDTLEKVDQRKVGLVVRLVEELSREVASDPLPPAEVDA